MFTAVAIGQLVERRLLRWDQPIGSILPGLPEDVGAATVDQLLTHRSGLQDYLRPQNREAIRSARTATDLLPLAVKEGLAFAPGAKQAYSNSGYVVLGAIVEKLSGLSYPDYLRTRIFAPAGMETVTLDGQGERATPMTKRSPDGGEAQARHPAPIIGGERASPAGGAVASALDMLRFGEALRAGKLVSRRTLEALWAPRVPGRPGDGARLVYGYGFARMDYADGRWVVGHGGGSLGINAEFEIFPRSGETAIVLSNFDPPAATDAMALVRSSILGRPLSCS
jgi:CubicO group peptidase (beta-lactamase class C family)